MEMGKLIEWGQLCGRSDVAFLRMVSRRRFGDAGDLMMGRTLLVVSLMT